jgi:hypothetical protein
MTKAEIAGWVLGFIAVAYLVIRECIKGPSPGDADQATPKEREQAVRIRQLRLSHAMKKRGVHLLAGKHYRPVLTKTEPVTARPRLAAVTGGKR